MRGTEICLPGGQKIDFSAAFTSLSLFKPGPQGQVDIQLEKRRYSAKFKLGCDLQELFPYLNSEIDGSHYYRNPEYIKFMHAERLCILYSQEGAFTSVKDHGDAISFLWTLLALLADVARRSVEITPDFRRYSSASPVDIYRLLPGNNCKECGYDTCLAFASALSRQYVSKNSCPHLPNPVEEKSTYVVVDSQGRKIQTLSLATDSDDLQKEVVKKKAHIKKLEARLAEFEQQRTQRVEINNAKLLSPLTEREIEVLKLVAGGATNKEISKMISISAHTVKSHIIHIFDKLGVNDRSQASVWAAKSGLL